MTVRRILPYASGAEMEASREFYVDVLGLEVAMDDPVLGLQSPDNPTAQLVIPPTGMEDPQPAFGIDVGEPAAVDAAHAEALRRGPADRLRAERRAVAGAPLLRRGPVGDDRERPRTHGLRAPPRVRG